MILEPEDLPVLLRHNSTSDRGCMGCRSNIVTCIRKPLDSKVGGLFLCAVCASEVGHAGRKFKVETVLDLNFRTALKGWIE